MRRKPCNWAGPILLASAMFYTVIGCGSGSQQASTEQSTVQTVPQGEAGKAGELQVTEEAIGLAEITLEPAASRMVAERLEVSGVAQTGGNQLVKITPRVAGKVVRLLAQLGDDVRAGQALAVLESPELAQAQSAYKLAAARASAAQTHLKRQRQLASMGQFGRPQVEEARTRAIEADREVHEAEHHLSEERTKLAEAQSERKGLESRVRQATAELDVAKSKLDRAESLFREELISKQEVERIRADHRKAAADVDFAIAQLDQGDERIKGARSRVEAAEGELKLARRRAGIYAQSLQREERVFKGQFHTNREIVAAEAEAREAAVEAEGAANAVRILGGRPGAGNSVALTSPIAGRVQERQATLGETIDPDHTAFVVVNLDRLWAELAVSPADIGSIRLGDQVALESESQKGRSLRGAVISIGTQADPSTRTVGVRTTLSTGGSHDLRPGAFLRGHLVTDVRRERVTVPLGAIQDHSGRPTVYVSLGQPGKFEIRHVVLGATGDGWREVAEGLKAGEKVASSGTFYLKSEALKDSLADGCCAPGG